MYSTVVSDVGTVRSNNQDSAFAGEHLIAICDGMGGHAGGDTASTIAIRSLAHIEQDNVDGDVQVVSHMMATSVMAAHDAIVGKAKRERRLAGMGTTVTSVALVAGCWVLAHIGDSRAYLLHDGRLIRMTSDHSYVQHLIDTGRISEAEARNHPQRNVVMRVLGDFDIDSRPDIAIRKAHPGDRWLLCSDGLCGVLEDSTLEEVLSTCADQEECAQRLVSMALRAGSTDNVTAVIADATLALDADAFDLPHQTPLVGGAANVKISRSANTGAVSNAKSRPSYYGTDGNYTGGLVGQIDPNDALGVKTEAVALGESLDGIEKELARYGADTVWVADDKIFNPFRTLPHTAVMCGLIEQEKPQIALFGATPVGRDFAPRVSSALHSGLTADCTQLEIGDHKDAKTGREYKDLLYQIRPAFGGNIIATIVNPDHRPQMATVREGVMRKEYAAKAGAVPAAGEVKRIDWQRFVKDTDLAVRIIDRQIEERRIDIKGAPIIVAGGYGMGSKENFRLVHELADVLGAEVGASRAAVDAGFTEHARQVGQTGVTVRPKLYIACGISGQIQHTAGMDQSSMIISINTDPDAPIARIADYAITGDVNEVIPKMIKYYKQNSK